MPANRFVSAVIVFVTIVSVSCGPSGKDDGDKGFSGAGKVDVVKNQGGRLVIGMQQEPEILNEAVNSMVAVVYVCNLVFSKFVKYDDKMRLVPDLITEIPTLQNGGISSDYLTYTYHLRDDAFWHDGTPVTSADAEFSWRVMMHPDINVETRQGWDIVERVETPDPHTVVFHLSERYVNFVGDCFYDESVLPAHLLSGSLGPDFQGLDFHRNPVGSGPFKFHEWESGSHITVKANRDWYGEGPFLDEISIVFIPDGNALMLQLESGRIDAIDNSPDILLKVADRIPRIKVYRNAALFNEHLDLNHDNLILSEKKVRSAIAKAIDRDLLSRKIYEGVWLPAYGDEHPSSMYYSGAGEDRFSYDPERAGRLLREAGWIDRDGDGIREKDGKPLKLEISTTTGRRNRELTEVVIQQQLKDVGIDLGIVNYHPTVLFGSFDEGGILKNGEFDIALYAFLTPPDPSTKEGSYSESFIPPAGQNYSRIRNGKLTELLAEGSGTVSTEKRIEIYNEVSLILAEEVPIVPLLWVTQLDAMPDSLKGYRPNPTQSGDTWNAAEWHFER